MLQIMGYFNKGKCRLSLGLLEKKTFNIGLKLHKCIYIFQKQLSLDIGLLV